MKAAQLRPIDAMGQLACPVFVIGSEKVALTSVAQTRRVFDAARQPKQLWIVEGAAHVDLHRFAQLAYETRVAAFLEAHLRASPKP